MVAFPLKSSKYYTRCHLLTEWMIFVRTRDKTWRVSRSGEAIRFVRPCVTAAQLAAVSSVCLSISSSDGSNKCTRNSKQRIHHLSFGVWILRSLNPQCVRCRFSPPSRLIICSSRGALRRTTPRSRCATHNKQSPTESIKKTPWAWVSGAGCWGCRGWLQNKAEGVTDEGTSWCFHWKGRAGCSWLSAG